MSRILIFSVFLLVQISASTQYALTPRIVKGEDASRNQFPFIASVQLSFLRLFPYVHVCAGTVIDDYWILTTAFCVQKASGIGIPVVKIRMFFTYANDDRVQTINIIYKITHENYNSSVDFLANDIGLMKLDSAVSQPSVVKLPRRGSKPTGSVFIAGWGRIGPNDITDTSEVLQYALVTILENEQCQRLLSHIQTSSRLEESQICTYSRGDRVTACTGDTGGPVFRYVDGVPEIVGLLSWTLNPCGIVGAPTVNTRVSEFTEWVAEKMSSTNIGLYIDVTSAATAILRC